MHTLHLNQPLHRMKGCILPLGMQGEPVPKVWKGQVDGFVSSLGGLFGVFTASVILRAVLGEGEARHALPH